MVFVDKTKDINELAKEFVGNVYKKMNENGSYDYFFITDFHCKTDGNIEVEMYQMFCRSDKDPGYSYYGSFWMVLDSFASYMEYHDESSFDEMIDKMDTSVFNLYQEYKKAQDWRKDMGYIREDD